LSEITKEIKIDNLPTLSVCMIVKNEENHIKKLLDIIFPVVDEIVIVDTGSTDGTISIIEEFLSKDSIKIKLIKSIWEDDFSKTRNISIKNATKDYIIWLDADDVMNKQDIIVLKDHISKNPNKGVYLKLINTHYESTTQSMQLRVFPNISGVEFRGRIHEQVSFSLEELDIKFSFCDIPVIHEGYESEEGVKNKLLRNFKILIQELKEKPEDFLINLNLARTTIFLNKLGLATKCTDKAIELFKKNKHGVSNNDVLPVFLLKMNLLSNLGKEKEIIEMMEEIRIIFNKSQLYRFSMGEVYFKVKDYKKAYLDLSVLLSGKLDLNETPINPHLLTKNLIFYLLTCSLYIGDDDTVDFCMQKILNDKTFKIKR